MATERKTSHATSEASAAPTALLERFALRGSHPARAIRTSRRVRISLLIAAILLTAGGTGTAMLRGSTRGTAWYEYYSSDRLLGIMRTSGTSNPEARVAWNELWRRDTEGELASTLRPRLIDACLQAQAAGPAAQLGGEVEFLAGNFLRDRMSTPQKEAFLQQLVALQLRVRPRVASDSQVPIEIVYRANLLGKLQLRLVEAKIVSRGQTLAEWPELLRSTDASGSFLGAFDCPSPGIHPLSLKATAQLRMQGLGDGGTVGYQVQHEWPILLSSSVEVLPAGAADDLAVIEDPSLQKTLARLVRPKHLEFSNCRANEEQDRVDGSLTACVEVDRLPVGVAFEVVARANGREYSLGLLCRPQGLDVTDQEVACHYSGPVVQAVDLVLRGGPAAACRTVDAVEVWQGELVYRNVRVWPLDPERQDWE